MNILLITTLFRWKYAPSKKHMLCCIVSSHYANAVNPSLLLILCGKFLQYTYLCGYMHMQDLTVGFSGSNVCMLLILQHNSNDISILCSMHMFNTRIFLFQNWTVLSLYEVSLWMVCGEVAHCMPKWTGKYLCISTIFLLQQKENSFTLCSTVSLCLKSW